MSPSKLGLTAALLLSSISGAFAQAASDLKITKVIPALQDSPAMTAQGYDKRVPRAGKWLEVEVEFDWQPRAAIPKYLDSIKATYYILLNNAGSTPDRKPTMLVGTIEYESIPQGRGLKIVAYVSPRTLERFFDGNPPAVITQLVVDVGVVLSGGAAPSELSFKGRGEWWPKITPTPGFVLNKLQTPFAFLSWDYYQPVKTAVPPAPAPAPAQ